MPRFFNSSFNSSSDSSLVPGVNLKITVTLKEHAIKKAFKCAVRSSRTSYRFRSLHLFWLHKCRLPEKVANRVFTHSASLRYASFVHTLFAFTSGLAGSSASEQSTLLCKHSQDSRSTHQLHFVTL